jgi:hypothetical protein
MRKQIGDEFIPYGGTDRDQRTEADQFTGPEG